MLSKTTQVYLIRSSTLRFLSTTTTTFTTKSADSQTFRQSDTQSIALQKQTRYGLLSIPTGERVAIWRRSGKVDLVDGPKRVFLWGSRHATLPRYIANPTEFIRIITVDGEKLYKYGPCAVVFDPLVHEDVRVLKAITIDANEAMVVYQESKGKVTRRVVYGAAMHVPRENEWVHSFQWHGRDPTAPVGVNRKMPGVINFTKLRLMPDQIYFDVENVRTRDDALISVKLMIFYGLKDIEKMLDRTHDSISDIINSVSADVIHTVADQTFDQFKASIDRLNKLETYSELTARAKAIGYEVSNVVFRGYVSSNKLQQMHDSAIEKRTFLVLETETERQAQELQDYKLTREIARKEEERKLQESSIVHKTKMETIERQSVLQGQEETDKVKREILRKNMDLELEKQTKKHQEEQAHLQSLKTMGVELTQYLIAKEQKPEKLIKFESGTSSGQPAVHLHAEK